jgi:predicted transcriptional regulator of viral defense system
MGNVFFPNKNYYIGYANMFNYYDFTEQLFQGTFIINTSFAAEKIINNLVYKFIKVKNEYMYGIEEKEMYGGIVRISDMERTMVDLISRSDAVGGIIPASEKIEQAIKCKKCDIEKFIDYSVRFPKLTVRKIIGVILDRAEISETLTNPLYNTIKDSSLTSAEYNSRKGKINKKWRIIINDDTQE